MTTNALHTNKGVYDPALNFTVGDMPVRQSRINPAKVLIVYNSNAAATFSESEADYYIAARGLTSHKWGFDFGAPSGASYDPGSNAAMYSNVFEPVGEYMAANGIECVLCAPQVPIRYTVRMEDGSAAVAHGLPSHLGAAMEMVHRGVGVARAANGGTNAWDVKFTGIAGIANKSSDQITQDMGLGRVRYGQYITPTGLSTFEYQPAVPEWTYTTSRYRPFGRIGRPAMDGNMGIFGAGYTGFGHAETQAECRRIIDDAIAAEASFAENRDKPHLACLCTRTNPETMADRAAGFLEWARSMGVNVTYCSDASLTGNSLALSIAPAADAVFTVTGTQPRIPSAADAHQPVFCHIGGSSLWNTTPDIGDWSKVYDFLPGAWGYEQSSFTFAYGLLLLQYGGCATSCTYQEPLTDSDLVDAIGFAYNVFAGHSICEAIFRAGFNMFCHNIPTGDPLYAPYGVLPVADSGVPTIQNRVTYAIGQADVSATTRTIDDGTPRTTDDGSYREIA